MSTPPANAPMGFAGLATLVSTLPAPPAAAAPAGSTGREIVSIISLILFTGVGFMKIISNATPAPPRYTLPPMQIPVSAPLPAPTRSPVAVEGVSFVTLIPESKPAAGLKRSLTQAEIMYCLAESARLNVLEPLVDERLAPQLNGYNSDVADYNLRCLDYHYDQYDLTMAQKQLDNTRLLIAQQARERLAAWH